ncbi:MAG: hypothetical protein FJW39_30240 [Acidobacteria bacterium]|nr:hypothetical protein [Acidobacteriota bacterium]
MMLIALGLVLAAGTEIPRAALEHQQQAARNTTRIQQLEADLARVTGERDQAVAKLTEKEKEKPPAPKTPQPPGAEEISLKVFQMLTATGGLAHLQSGFGFSGQLVYVDGFPARKMADDDVFSGKAVRDGVYTYTDMQDRRRTGPLYRIVK